MSTDQARVHFLEHWLVQGALFWPNVKNVPEILARGILKAMDLKDQNETLPVTCLWACNSKEEVVNVAVAVTNAAISLTIQTNFPINDDGRRGTHPQPLFVVRNFNPSQDGAVEVVDIKF